MKSLSDLAMNVEGQPMFKTLDKVEKLERSGTKIIHFELGEPNFDTPQNISDALINAIRNGDTHYVNSYGKYNLRLAVQETTMKSRGFCPDIDQILITPGANAIIYMAMCCLVNRGEEVILPNPGFPTYISAAKMVGAKIIDAPLYESNSFRLNPSDLEKLITPKTRLIIINSPSNPTGAMMTNSELLEVAKIAEKNDIYLLSDEIYGRMVFSESEKFFSPGIHDHCKERTIIANGFSKAFAMTGWRLGVAIGPKVVIDKMMLTLQTINSCVPGFIQAGGLEAIVGNKDGLNSMMQYYRKNRDYLVDNLNKIKGISCIEPKGAIYAFANIKKTNMSSQDFTNFLLEKCGIAVLPGTDFGSFGEGYVRFSYTTPFESIVDAIDKMKNFFGTW